MITADAVARRERKQALQRENRARKALLPFSEIKKKLDLVNQKKVDLLLQSVSKSAVSEALVLVKGTDPLMESPCEKIGRILTPFLEYVFTLPLHQRSGVLAACLKKFDPSFAIEQRDVVPTNISYQAGLVRKSIEIFVNQLVDFNWNYKSGPTPATPLICQARTGSDGMFPLVTFSNNEIEQNISLVQLIKSCNLILAKTSFANHNELISLGLIAIEYLNGALRFEKNRQLSVGQVFMSKKQILGLLLFNIPVPANTGVCNVQVYKNRLNAFLQVGESKETMRLCLELFAFFAVFQSSFLFIKEIADVKMGIFKDANIGITREILRRIGYDKINETRKKMKIYFSPRINLPQTQLFQQKLELPDFDMGLKSIIELIFT